MPLELLERRLDGGTAFPAGNAIEGPPEAKGGPAPDAILGRLGGLTARLARNESEIRAAQALRYRVFVEEFGAALGPAGAAGLDHDRYDAICDHLLVIDETREGAARDRIVGTYRLLRQSVARENGGFYSASEFEVDSLTARHPQLRFLELGRSCVLRPYRTRRTVELLWQGIWAYVLAHGLDALFGCASLPGTVPAAHALALSHLHHHHRAKGEWFVRARPELWRNMNLMPAEALSPRTAIAAMPPLVKGYLRLGAMIGDGAVVDAAFRTTDIMVVLPVAVISGRYVAHYGAEAQRFA